MVSYQKFHTEVTMSGSGAHVSIARWNRVSSLWKSPVCEPHGETVWKTIDVNKSSSHLYFLSVILVYTYAYIMIIIDSDKCGLCCIRHDAIVKPDPIMEKLSIKSLRTNLSKIPSKQIYFGWRNYPIFAALLLRWAGFFEKKKKKYLHFRPFLGIKITKVVEILPRGRPGSMYSAVNTTVADDLAPCVDRPSSPGISQSEPHRGTKISMA